MGFEAHYESCDDAYDPNYPGPAIVHFEPEPEHKWLHWVTSDCEDREVTVQLHNHYGLSEQQQLIIRKKFDELVGLQEVLERGFQKRSPQEEKEATQYKLDEFSDGPRSNFVRFKMGPKLEQILRYAHIPEDIIAAVMKEVRKVQKNEGRLHS